MKRVLFSILFTLTAGSSFAQSIPVDRLTPAFPTAQERQIADVVSWGTVLTALSLDAVHTWKTNCTSTWDACEGALMKAGIRVGVTLGAAQLVKVLVHRARPCSPACGLDAADASFYSMHTALAFSTLGGARLAFTLPLSVSTGGLRIGAGKHYFSDVLAGAGAGWLASRIR